MHRGLNGKCRLIVFCAFLALLFPAQAKAAEESATTITDSVTNKPSAPPKQIPASKSAAFTAFSFSKDYFPGTNDDHGNFCTGTELMRILAHGGKLFASTGEWTDLPYYKNKGDYLWTGPQILVKEKAKEPWRVDMSFSNAIRVDAIFSAHFLTDGAGRKLAAPVDLLIASPSTKDIATWTRDDASEKWSKSVVVDGFRSMRSFCLHTDTKTGIQYLFGGSMKPGSIFRAVYDPSVPGKTAGIPSPSFPALAA